MPKKLIYSVTTGRSGTVFLTELFKQNLPSDGARIFHERTGFPNFGVHTPDASHLTTFNSVGNAPNVQQFFRNKLEDDWKHRSQVHVEPSHFLCKAGLVENLPVISDKSSVHLVALKRDPYKIAWSFVNRFDFFNSGFTWLFSLDPRYPNVIVPSEPYTKHSMVGAAIWYVTEMFARIAYYRSLVKAEMPRVRWHEVNLEDIITPQGATQLLQGLGFDINQVSIPPKQNETTTSFFTEKQRQEAHSIFQRLWRDPEMLGTSFYRSGQRLGGEFKLEKPRRAGSSVVGYSVSRAGR